MFTKELVLFCLLIFVLNNLFLYFMYKKLYVSYNLYSLLTSVSLSF